MRKKEKNNEEIIDLQLDSSGVYVSEIEHERGKKIKSSELIMARQGQYSNNVNEFFRGVDIGLNFIDDVCVRYQEIVNRLQR